MNLSTALVSDVSSVVSDYLYTNKPFAITDLRQTDGPLPETFPIAAAAYLLRKDADPKPVLRKMLTADDLADARAKLRAYYLGDFPAQNYADAFVAAAKAAMA
jgi:CDP-glycerol glycerophosphotransferase (TagB/SpsB family)